MEGKFKIVFRGDIAPGFAMMEVRAKLQELFRIDGQAVSKLFMGRPVAIKRNLDEATAKKWCDIMLKVGALAEMVSEQPAATESANAQPGVPEIPENSENTASRESEAEDDGLSLSPVGADVLTPEERSPDVSQDVPTSHLSLDEVGADVLREDERKPFVELEVDLSHLQVEDTNPE